MSESVRTHRRQPTRLPHPWDFPGKNTGVGCHVLLQRIKMKSESEVAQSCLTLCDPMDCSLPGSSVHGIFQARVLQWGAIAFSIFNCHMDKNPQGNQNKIWQNNLTLWHGLLLFSCSVVSDSFVAPWTVACQAPLYVGLPRQEYWSGLLFPSAGIFLIQGLNLNLLHWQVDSLPLSH